jgi:hypothetical protein
MFLEVRIPVRSGAHRDGMGPGTFWTPCICPSDDPDWDFISVMRVLKGVHFATDRPDDQGHS